MMPIKPLPRLALVGLVLFAACSETTDPPGQAGPPAQIVITQGNNQSAPAFTEVTQPITFQIQDAAGTPVGAGHTVTFSTLGGGALTGSSTAVSGADGTVTAPPWRLGRTNISQTLRATLGTIEVEVNASIATQYDIVVRFFGDPVSATNQAFFQNAAARLEAIITGDIVNVPANLDLSGPNGCNTPGLPTVNETVDDIVIYAAVTTIDGPNNILGQATPCVGRRHPDANGKTMVAYGYMKFDVADFGTTISNPQEVILHEMLHVLGSGTLWETDRTLIIGKLGPDPRFTGPLAQAACVAFGATNTCATTVPLENVGSTGSRDFHWRETVFNNELMTSGYNNPPNPLSSMTIASMADLGFTVNQAPADAYTFVGTTQMSLVGAPARAGWEQVGILRGMLRPDGKVEAIKR